MALVFVPTLGAAFGHPGEADPETLKALSISETGDLTALKGWAGRYLHPAAVARARSCWLGWVAGDFAVLIASWAAYAAFGRGGELSISSRSRRWSTCMPAATWRWPRATRSSARSSGG